MEKHPLLLISDIGKGLFKLPIPTCLSPSFWPTENMPEQPKGQRESVRKMEPILPIFTIPTFYPLIHIFKKQTKTKTTFSWKDLGQLETKTDLNRRWQELGGPPLLSPSSPPPYQSCCSGQGGESLVRALGEFSFSSSPASWCQSSFQESEVFYI